jgi:PTS system beta-glucosides-specific IIC component
MPKSIRNILSPLLAISIMTPLTLIVVGPIINILSNGLSIGYAAVIGFSSTIAGLIFGGLWQVFVMLGLHWAFIPMLFNNLALIGSDDFAVMIMPAIFSQVGAGIGVFLRSRNRNLKSLSLSSSITGLMGVTEPIIYGVNLKLKKPFIIACISGCIGGAIVGFSKARTIGGGLPGLLAIPGVIGSEGFTVAMIGITISLVISIIATYILGFDDFKDDIKFPTKK